MDLNASNSLNLSENNDDEKQKVRSMLRERFLRAVTTLVGKECSIYLYSNNTVKGNFKGNDIEFENILFEKLVTPYVEVPNSIVRSSDIHYLEFFN